MGTRGLLDTLGERLAGTEPFDLAETEAALRGLAEEKGVKAGLHQCHAFGPDRTSGGAKPV